MKSQTGDDSIFACGGGEGAKQPLIPDNRPLYHSCCSSKCNRETKQLLQLQYLRVGGGREEGAKQPLIPDTRPLYHSCCSSKCSRETKQLLQQSKENI